VPISPADRWPELVAYGLLLIGLTVLVIIDLASRRLPDRIVGACTFVLLVGLTGQAALTGEWRRLLGALAAGAVVLVGYFIIGLLGNGRLGLGDVKLAGVLGLALGWLGLPQAIIGVLAGFAFGAVVSGVLLISGRSRESDYPFGPCMIAGAVAGAVLTPVLW
jgi:leader peptidase (prepilin peptidase)/N-methyltransferase